MILTLYVLSSVIPEYLKRNKYSFYFKKVQNWYDRMTLLFTKTNILLNIFPFSSSYSSN